MPITSQSEHFEVASVHGRFQPLHNGHMEYILAALKRTDFLYIGITQHVLHRLIQVESTSAVHRAEPVSNPLNYFERAAIINAALTGCKIPRERFAILPFPIEEPTELHEFLPPGIPVLTTTYDDWNLLKIETLEKAGYTVVNLWTRTEKEVAGHEIRRMIQEGDSAWRTQVPQAAVQLLEKYDVARRLQTLTPAPAPDS
jgi:cytidyltransferase-like protein